MSTPPKLPLVFDMHGEPGDFAGSAKLVNHNLSCCPFCCGHDVQAINTWTPHYWVECNDCGATGPTSRTTEKTTFATLAAAKREHRRAIEAAVAAWEARL